MRNTIKLKYIWCTLFLLLHWGFVKAQPICVARQYTVRDGLIQSNPRRFFKVIMVLYGLVLGMG